MQSCRLWPLQLSLGSYVVADLTLLQQQWHRFSLSCPFVVHLSCPVGANFALDAFSGALPSIVATSDLNMFHADKGLQLACMLQLLPMQLSAMPCSSLHIHHLHALQMPCHCRREQVGVSSVPRFSVLFPLWPLLAGVAVCLFKAMWGP